MRNVDLICNGCETRICDVMRSCGDSLPKCATCGLRMSEDWLPRVRHNAEWSDQNAVVVFKQPDGKILYPGRNDRPTPKGCERVTLRSLRQVERFEKENNVRSEIAWFDRGTGRGFDDHFRGESYSH